MKITDACVYPCPTGSASVRRMALEARALGFDSIVAHETPACTIDDVTVLCGVRITAPAAKDVINQVKQGKGPGRVVSVPARDSGFNRAVCGMAGVHILRDISLADKYAFDHITGKIAADNGTAVDLDLSPLITMRGHTRQKAIHRYLDILNLHHHFEFPITISSGARSVLSMRTVRDLAGLCSILGMDEEDVRQALLGVAQVTAPKPTAVTVIV